MSTACDLRNGFWTDIKFLKDSAKTRSQRAGLSHFQLLNQRERKRAGIQSICSSELTAPADVSAAWTISSCNKKKKEEVARSVWFQLEMTFSQYLPYSELGQAFNTIRNPKGKMKHPKSSLALLIVSFLPQVMAT